MAATGPDNSRRRHLEELSPELRMMIFREAVRQDEPIRISDDNKGLDVLRTCRLFRNEATEFYYRENTFLIDDLGSALIWCSRVGPHARFVRSVQFEVDISPLSPDMWAVLGVPQGGHDEQWKSIVRELPTWFPLLEELRIVIVARLLQAEVEGAQPRTHRYSNIAREIEGFHAGSEASCLTAVRTLCPNFRSLRVGCSFPRDWEDENFEEVELVPVGRGPNGITWFKVTQLQPAPPREDDEDEEDDDEGQDDEDEEEDEEEDEDGDEEDEDENEDEEDGDDI